MFPTAHIEVAYDAVKSFQYCGKLDTRLEGGQSGSCGCPPPGGETGRVSGKKREGDYVLDAVRAGRSWSDLVDEFPLFYASKEPELRKLFERYGVKRTVTEQPRVIILYGEPGSGKSSSAELMFKEAGIKPFRLTIGKWADGYEYEEGVFFDDMEPNLVPRAQLLVLMEKGQVRWEVKGGSVLMQVRLIIITSNYDPLEWFPKRDDQKDKELMHSRGVAVVRRAEVYYCNKTDGVALKSSGNTSPDDLSQVRKNQKSLMEMWNVPPVRRERSAPAAMSSSSSL